MVRSALRQLLAGVLVLLLAGGTALAQTTERRVLSRGVTLITRRAPGTKVLAAKLFVRCGAIDETECPAGTNYLLARLLTDESAHPLAKEFGYLRDEIGGGLSVSAAEEYTQFSCVTLRPNMADALNLLAYLVTEPRIKPSALKDAKDAAARELQARDAFELARDSFLACQFPGTRWALPVAGSENTLSAIREEHLMKLFHSRYVAGNMVLCVVGDVTAEQVANVADDAFRKVSASRAPGRQLPPLPQPGQGPDVIERDVPIGAVMVGCRAPGLMDAAYPAIAVANAILGGGKASRIFTELRDRLGIGYEVGTYLAPLAGAGYLLGYTITEASQDVGGGIRMPVLEMARKGLSEQFQALADGGISDAEVTRAKRYLVGSYALRHQRASDQAFLLGWWEVCGGGYQGDETFPSRVERVTKEDVVRLAKQFLSHLTVSVVLPERSNAPTTNGQSQPSQSGPNAQYGRAWPQLTDQDMAARTHPGARTRWHLASDR